MDNQESELESFRQQWRAEVLNRNKNVTNNSEQNISGQSSSGPGRPAKRQPPPSNATGQHDESFDTHGEYEPTSYHDLENKEEFLKLGNEASRSIVKDKEPKSALDHYEKAVEKETTGKLGDSVDLYRKAFKLDSRVHEQYKNKYFPPTASKPPNVNPSNAAATVPNTAHHSLDGGGIVPSISELIESFAGTSIEAGPPETSLSPSKPCFLSKMPDELLVEILTAVAIKDVGMLAHLTQVCKKLSFLIVTEDRIWKRLCLGTEFGYPAMLYSYACDIQGRSLLSTSIQPSKPSDLTPSKYSNYRAQFRGRPRLRFGGCYISTVNYQRPGAGSQSARTWYTPVHIVTYYRYLRFFRDGTVISLLTTAEPQDVVHYLTPEHLEEHHGSGTLPSAVVKDALKGRWRLSGPRSYCYGALESDVDPLQYAQSYDEQIPGPGEYLREPTDSPDLEELEGDLHVETKGVVPKYTWKMQFAFGSAGRKDGTRNNKLIWKGYWSYNRLTDDWGEFGLKNDRPFYWSRVKSYGIGDA